MRAVQNGDIPVAIIMRDETCGQRLAALIRSVPQESESRLLDAMPVPHDRRNGPA
jgi:hypothetical protein